MDCARGLARLDRSVLRAYSVRTIETLRSILPLRLALPHLEPFLARNVAKEIEKDALVIRRSAQAPAGANAPGRELLDDLLEQTKEIDRKFVSMAGGFQVGIVLRYEEIAPVRLRRMGRLFDVTRRVRAAYGAERSLRAALRACYPQAELEHVVREILWLYAQEALVLSRSVRLPALLGPVREMVAQRLVHVMNETAARLAADAARVAYRAAPGARTRKV
jgi:hypothetical protein